MKKASYTYNLISFIELQIKNLYVLKSKLAINKPFWFQKKKLQTYGKKIALINKKLETYNKILLEELLKLEQTKK